MVVTVRTIQNKKEDKAVLKLMGLPKNRRKNQICAII
jgi:hypothetical protein